MRKITHILGVATAGIAMATATMAADYQALRDDARVHSELLGASLAYLIDEGCPSISLRKLTFVGKALSLRSYAKRLGYSGSEVDAYVNDQTEQARFRAIASTMLAENGVITGDTASFCTAGRAEMEAGTFTGAILRGG